ncbi:lipoprotein insertase outer membrane protein LolB [Psychrobacter lutiphocae]|uniref:lipoprotein insertase outer membrane protein LolB n=1 Tax=Psychrobacter lutiphocae TaxID=540500 RepID=UPI0003A2C715|nr:lipoprotein insertase outer membrane protein LolB [Psychrobacter lutiphocae]
MTTPPSIPLSPTSVHTTDHTKTNMLITSKKRFGLIIASCALVATGCQTTQQMNAGTSSTVVAPKDTAYPELLQAFNIRGKIGVTTPQTESTRAQSGSAFYVWAQQDDRFAIDITGALGIGHTVIEYNGETATLVSERTGEISASSPEALLQQATGWQAPISQLRYWISGRPAPSDINSQLDLNGRLSSSQNNDWTANFDYPNTTSSQRPSRIKVVRHDGHRVTMTIEHAK